MGFTKWLRKKREGEIASTALHEHQDKPYKEAHNDHRKQTKFRNDRIVHSLQQPTTIQHLQSKGENCVKGKIQALKIALCQEVKPPFVLY